MCKFPGTFQDTILATSDLKSTVNNFQILRISHLKILIDECKNELLLGILRNNFPLLFFLPLTKTNLEPVKLLFLSSPKKIEKKFLSFSLTLFLPTSLSPSLSLSLSFSVSSSLSHSLSKKIERRRIFLSQDFDWTIRPRIIKLNDQRKSIWSTWFFNPCLFIYIVFSLDFSMVVCLSLSRLSISLM